MGRGAALTDRRGSASPCLGFRAWGQWGPGGLGMQQRGFPFGVPVQPGANDARTLSSILLRCRERWMRLSSGKTCKRSTCRIRRRSSNTRAALRHPPGPRWAWPVGAASVASYRHRVRPRPDARRSLRRGSGRRCLAVALATGHSRRPTRGRRVRRRQAGSSRRKAA